MSVKVHEAYSIDSFQDQLLWWDDFLGDQLKDEWSIGGNGGGSVVVVDAQTGGIARITTDGDDNDNYHMEWGTIRSLLVTKKVSMEARVKHPDTTSLNPQIMLQFDGDNRILLWFDTDSAHTNWQASCVDAASWTTVDSGVAFDASYHIYRIECHTHGSNHVHFYIDGTEISNSPISTNVPDDAADVLEPYIWMRTRTDAARTLDIDYVVVRQDI